jgi:arylsulfatase A-like enzyme
MTRHTTLQALLSFFVYPVVFGLGLALTEGVLLMMVEDFQSPDLLMLGLSYGAALVALGLIGRVAALVLPPTWRTALLVRHAHYLALTALFAVYNLDRRLGVDLVKRNFNVWGALKILVALAMIAAVAIAAVAALRGLARLHKVAVSALVIVLFTGVWLLSLPQDEEGDKGAQVLLVSIDSLRADHVGSYGYTGNETPNIDALAAEGTLFEQAYAAAPYTAASMAAMSAGCYPFHTGVRNFGMVLDKKVKTLAEILGKKGYDCVTVGGPAYEDEAGSYSRGSRNIDITCLSLPEYVHYKWYNRANRRPMKERTVSALAYLRHNRNRDYFLWVHYWDPHAPYFPPAAFAPEPSDSRINGSVEQLERFIKKLDTPQVGDIERLKELYDAEVRFVDDNIGMLMEMYRSTSSRRLLALTADHGEALGEEGMFLHAEDLIEPMIHIPLIIDCSWLPEVRPLVRVPVSAIDIVETFLEGLKIGNPNLYRDGRSLLPLMNGQETGEFLQRPIYFESRGAAKVGIRRGEAKLVVDVKTKELRITDIGEQVQMMDLLLGMMKLSSPDQLKIYKEKTDRKMNKKLKTLGYFN